MKRALLVVTILFRLLVPSAEARTVTIAWDPNSEPDLAGYLFSYGTTSGQYTTTLDVGNVTSFVFSTPEALPWYFIAVRAYNTGGAISTYSFEVPMWAAPSLPVVTGVSSSRTSPQPAGTGITFSAITRGGGTPLQFKWWIENGATSTVGRQWSTSNMFTWTPRAPSSDYTIRVWTRRATSTEDAPDNPEATLTMTFTVGKRLEPAPRRR